MRTKRTGTRAECEQGTVRAVTRALSLLEQLGLSTRGLKLSEISQYQALSPATCLRLLTTMQERGFVRFDAEANHWSIGATALYVGTNFRTSRHIVRVAERLISQFGRDHNVTVNLAVLDGLETRFLYRLVPGCQPSAPGEQIPAHCSALGKAILSGKPQVEARALLRGPLIRKTPSSLCDRRALFEDLERASRNGYAVDNGENVRGLRCIAAPIFDEYHRPIAAISVAGPIRQLTGEQVPCFGRSLMVAAERIMLRFGGRRPPP